MNTKEYVIKLTDEEKERLKYFKYNSPIEDASIGGATLNGVINQVLEQNNEPVKNIHLHN
jgi:hypothetical protein|tara:strand:- start:268 stop:447 length:180 start_codon:yes stop_codon:yes gene_type:complete